jgi:hypothetical protein
MGIARLVLDYLRALTLPLIIAIVLVIFRKELRRLAGKLRIPEQGSAEIPGIGKYSWSLAVDRALDRAEEASRGAENISSETPSASITTDSSEAGQVQENDEFRAADEAASLMNMRTIAGYRDWGQLQKVALENPSAAVLLGWKLVHLLVYHEAYSSKALVAEDWESQLPLIAKRLGATRRVAAVLADLKDLRDRVENGERVSRSDALEYIDAAETVLRAWLGAGADLEPRFRYCEKN